MLQSIAVVRSWRKEDSHRVSLRLFSCDNSYSAKCQVLRKQPAAIPLLLWLPASACRWKFRAFHQEQVSLYPGMPLPVRVAPWLQA